MIILTSCRENPGDPIEIKGVVLSTEKLPMENVEVSLFSFSARELAFGSTGYEIVALDTTDENGNFSFDWISESRRNYEVWVTPFLLKYPAASEAIRINEWKENNVELILDKPTILPLTLIGDSIIPNYSNYQGILNFYTRHSDPNIKEEYYDEYSIPLTWERDTTIFLYASSDTDIYLDFSPENFPDTISSVRALSWNGFADGSDTMEIPIRWWPM